MAVQVPCGSCAALYNQGLAQRDLKRGRGGRRARRGVYARRRARVQTLHARTGIRLWLVIRGEVTRTSHPCRGFLGCEGAKVCEKSRICGAPLRSWSLNGRGAAYAVGS